jgi:hypothetical protein
LFQNPIPQSFLGDFCNTIGQKQTIAVHKPTSALPPKADIPNL